MAAAGKAGRVLMTAGKKGVVKVSRPAYASKGSVLNAQLKFKKTPSASSELGKFFGMRDRPSSQISQLIAQFTRLHSPQHPGKKKIRLFEEKVMAMLSGKDKDKIGMPEIAKLISQHFGQAR